MKWRFVVTLNVLREMGLYLLVSGRISSSTDESLDTKMEFELKSLFISFLPS